MPIKNLSGKKFGRLKVLTFTGDIKPTKWLCKCECGKEKVVIGTSLSSGRTKSCGCLRSELMKKLKTKHGMADNHFYNKWLSLKRRCKNKTDNHYHRYGGRGITVCKRWLKFENFMDDMHEGYTKSLEKYGIKNTTIDRIDNDGDYCKENCRWATNRQQSLNHSRNRMIEFNGERKPLTQLAEEHGLTLSIVSQRIDKLKWSLKKALTTKKLNHHD